MMNKRCGGYRVRIRRGYIVVVCRACGVCGSFTARGARKLASRLRGVLGRFETPAPRDERRQLADDLLRAVRRF